MRLAALVLLAGCGRFGFGDALAADAPRGDAARDAAAHDGRAADARPLDAGPDAFDEAAACAPYAICDSFEAPTFAPVWTPGSEVSLDTTHVHRGAQSVHVHVPALNAGDMGFSQIIETQTVSGPSQPTTFYVRAWLYLGSLPAGANHLELISIEGNNTTGDYAFAFSNDASLFVQADGMNAHAMVPPPTNTWLCLIMKVTRGGAGAGELALTSDVLPMLDLPGAKTEPAGFPIQTIAMGLGLAGTNVVNAQPALDMWIDDVIVDPAMPTCAD